MSSWKPSQLEKLGVTWENKKGNTLRVESIIDCRKGGKTYYKVSCSECSKDTELFPDGFEIVKSNIGKTVPCACTRSYKYTENQYMVKVKRVLDKSNYKFLGWEGEYKESYSYLKVVCNTTGIHRVVGLTYLLSQDTLPRADRSGNFKEIDDHIETFMETGKYLDGTRFFKGEEECWLMICPKCSYDEYVKNGLCSGVFKTIRGNCLKGSRPCRCSHAPLSKRQQEFRVGKILKRKGLTFKRFLGEYTGITTLCEFICKDGHINTGTVESIPSRKVCSVCYKKERRLQGDFNGYFPHKASKKDFLYFIRLKDEYLKVGRAFILDNRFYVQSSCIIKEARIKRDQLKIISVHSGLHQEVYDTEQWVHEELRDRGFEYNEEDWSTELFQLGCEGLVGNLLNRSGLEKVK